MKKPSQDLWDGFFMGIFRRYPSLALPQSIQAFDQSLVFSYADEGQDKKYHHQHGHEGSELPKA